MRWGLIGTGAHASQVIAPALKGTREQELAGALGSTPAKSSAFAETFGGRAYGSLDDLLADSDIDAVFISTPNGQHRAQTEAAAAAGKHVLVEKPMALTPDDCRAMIGACEAAGVTLGVGFQRRLHPVAREVKRLIDEGALGEIVTMQGEFHTAYPPWNNWRADRAQAGSDILAAVGVHLMDLLCWFDGSEIADVAAIVDASPEFGLDQTIAASLRFESGAMASTSITRRARAQVNGVWVYGTKGMAGGPAVLGANSDGRFATRLNDQYEERELPMPDMFVAQFEAFAEAVRTGGSPMATGADGLRSVELSQRIIGS
jgi:1,5-anhydro-D-fructose reductase (1,5-anhydro-D-mannitol-forming)